MLAVMDTTLNDLFYTQLAAFKAAWDANDAMPWGGGNINPDTVPFEFKSENIQDPGTSYVLSAYFDSEIDEPASIPVTDNSVYWFDINIEILVKIPMNIGTQKAKDITRKFIKWMNYNNVIPKDFAQDSDKGNDENSFYYRTNVSWQRQDTKASI